MGLCYNLDITRGQQAVLIALADHAKTERGICWPSVGCIAHKIKYSERQVQRLVRQLEELQILKVIQNERGGRGVTPTYQLNLEMLYGRERPELQKPPRPGKGVWVEREKGDVLLDEETQVSARCPPSIAAAKGDIFDQKGDISTSKRVTSGTKKDDTIMSPEPLLEPSVIEPSERTVNSEQKDSDSLRSSGASPLRAEVTSTQTETQERVDIAKQRFFQFRNSAPRTFQLMINTALGDDEQAIAEFKKWVAAEIGTEHDQQTGTG